MPMKHNIYCSANFSLIEAYKSKVIWVPLGKIQETWGGGGGVEKQQAPTEIGFSGVERETDVAAFQNDAARGRIAARQQRESQEKHALKAESNERRHSYTMKRLSSSAPEQRAHAGPLLFGEGEKKRAQVEAPDDNISFHIKRGIISGEGRRDCESFIFPRGFWCPNIFPKLVNRLF